MGNVIANESSSNNLISIILPIYNEEEIIEELLENITGDLNYSKLKYEIIICENGSTDGTCDKLKEISNGNNSIKLLSLDSPSYGGAIKYGISEATGDFAFIINADLWNINFVNKSLFYLKKGSDIVIGSKTLKNSRDLRPFIRRFITKLFSIYLRLFFKYKGTDTHGLKGFKLDSVKGIAKRCKTVYELFDTELVLIAQADGLKIKEIPVEIKEERPAKVKILLRIPKTLKELYYLHKSLKRV